MKKIVAVLLFIAAHKMVMAQSVGIGTTTPNPSAQLDVSSTSKGVLVPRMTDAEKNAIPSPVQGLMVFNTNTNSFQYYNGVSWVNISHSGIISGTANKVPKFNSPWGLTANTLITDNGAGVAINTSNALPNSSALLDMVSTNKGVLIPRMTTAERTAIATPATGLLVFDNSIKSFWFYNGTAWNELVTSGSSMWGLNGNDIYNNNTGNVGIGTDAPLNKLQVQGSLLITSPTIATNTQPTVAQTKTMVNATTINFLDSDSTGRIYDPGGPSGNYLPNLNATAFIPVHNNIGIEINAETMELGTGDSLIIKELSSSTNYLLAVGNGYNNTGKWVFNTPYLYIIFKSNADANTGTGFTLTFKRLYDRSYFLPDTYGAAGNSLFFDTKNGAFRSGFVDNSVRGIYSTAMGDFTTASGEASTALGHSTTASGYYSTAIGEFSTASGITSTAMGFNTTASGTTSTAMGGGTTASGDGSTAMGVETTASGDYSTAMGYHVSTNNQEGSFVIGDKSTTTDMTAANPNNFRARFAGGYRLFTSANLSTGCTLFAGDNAWTTGSDIRTKENFAEVNGEDFLKKIAGFHLTSWNYKTQNPAIFRHYGPMAQDFYAAFGKDKYGSIGNDTTINSADFAGVSFIAIQALEKRTTVQEATVNSYKKENERLEAKLEELQKLVLQQQELTVQMQKEIELLKKK